MSRFASNFAKHQGLAAKHLPPEGGKAMQINDADVAELVDARDLKFPAPAQNKAVFWKTPPNFLAEPARRKRDLENAFAFWIPANHACRRRLVWAYRERPLK